jgi:hypothetical protein
MKTALAAGMGWLVVGCGGSPGIAIPDLTSPAPVEGGAEAGAEAAAAEAAPHPLAEASTPEACAPLTCVTGECGSVPDGPDCIAETDCGACGAGAVCASNACTPLAGFGCTAVADCRAIPAGDSCVELYVGKTQSEILDCPSTAALPPDVCYVASTPPNSAVVIWECCTLPGTC